MQAEREPIPLMVCPSCGEGNTPDVDFCLACGAPVGRFTTLDPFKVILAEGFMLRKAASARIRPIVIIGIWLAYGIPLGAGLLGLLMHSGDLQATRVLMGAAAAVLYVLIIFRITRNFMRNRPGPGPSRLER